MRYNTSDCGTDKCRISCRDMETTFLLMEPKTAFVFLTIMLLKWLIQIQLIIGSSFKILFICTITNPSTLHSIPMDLTFSPCEGIILHFPLLKIIILFQPISYLTDNFSSVILPSAICKSYKHGNNTRFMIKFYS